MNPTYQNLNGVRLCRSLREKCPNTEFFLVYIFPYLVRIRENMYLDTFHAGDTYGINHLVHARNFPKN